jgi:hypothetical protein
MSSDAEGRDEIRSDWVGQGMYNEACCGREKDEMSSVGVGQGITRLAVVGKWVK